MADGLLGVALDHEVSQPGNSLEICIGKRLALIASIIGDAGGALLALCPVRTAVHGTKQLREVEQVQQPLRIPGAGGTLSGRHHRFLLSRRLLWSVYLCLRLTLLRLSGGLGSLSGGLLSTLGSACLLLRLLRRECRFYLIRSSLLQQRRDLLKLINNCQDTRLSFHSLQLIRIQLLVSLDILDRLDFPQTLPGSSETLSDCRQHW
mmetsp:Transcript_11211/g.33637  ORF Transcript_11211/g.33637 Transcript_11211/m.33637 type:complete len:206 (-) Transcript_11211:218-835(-)